MLLSTSWKHYYWVRITSLWEGQTGTVVDSLLHDTLRDSDLILVTNFLGKKSYTKRGVPTSKLLSTNIILRQISVEKKKSFSGRGHPPQPTCLWCCSFLLEWFFWSYFTHIYRPRQRAWAARTTVRCLVSTWQTPLHCSVYPVSQIQSSVNARGGTAPDPIWGILGARAAQGSQRAHKLSQFEESLIAEIGGY